MVLKKFNMAHSSWISVSFPNLHSNLRFVRHKCTSLVNALAAIARDAGSDPARVSPLSPTQISVTCENTENTKV
jgi:hypothetical protein